MLTTETAHSQANRCFSYFLYLSNGFIYIK